MKNIFKFISRSLDDTEKLAENLALIIDRKGLLICLYGDIGSGKTTFIKYLAKFLGIKEKVTSPSFVILNEYRSKNLKLYHFDLYRLEKEGVNSILEEITEYFNSENSITVIEWAEFSSENLPEERLEIKIKYLSEFSREFIFEGFGDKILKSLRFFN
jgi:tRNA threonylcarbamoyladenosine biosynthesis protein TsaE